MQNHKKAIAFCFLFIALAGGWYFLTGRNDVSDVRQSAERAEQYNRQSGESIDDATGETGRADEKLDRAESSIERSQDAIKRSIDTGDRNKTELEECKRIVSECQADASEARRILESIRSTGKET